MAELDRVYTTFEFTEPLKPTQQQDFLVRYGTGELAEDRNSAPLLSKTVMSDVYDHFNLHDSPYPKDGLDDPHVRAIQTTQYYLRNIRFPDGNTFGNIVEDIYSDYFANDQTNMNRAAIGVGFTLYSFNTFLKENMVDFVYRMSNVSSDKLSSQLERRIKPEGKMISFADKGDIFISQAHELVIPPYQVHLIEGIEKLSCGRAPAVYDGAALIYSAFDTAWSDILKAGD